MKMIAALLIVLALTGCFTDEPNAKRVVEMQGYTDVQITGYRWFGCGDKDSVHTGFTAKSAKGQPVSGVVCSGITWFGKNYTVRFD